MMLYVRLQFTLSDFVKYYETIIEINVRLGVHEFFRDNKKEWTYYTKLLLH